MSPFQTPALLLPEENEVCIDLIDVSTLSLTDPLVVSFLDSVLTLQLCNRSSWIPL